VPNILTSASNLGDFKEAAGRNLPKETGKPELDKQELSKSPYQGSLS
jgi:hypothetical protein